MASRQSIGGQVPPRAASYNAGPPPPPAAAPRATVAVAEPNDPIESRALVALGYPLWPLALLGLLDRKQSRYLKKQALQALGFNVGFAGFGGMLALVSNVPFLGWSAAFILPFLVPIFLVCVVFFGIKVWQGDDLNIPIIGDFIEDKLPAA